MMKEWAGGEMTPARKPQIKVEKPWKNLPTLTRF